MVGPGERAGAAVHSSDLYVRRKAQPTPRADGIRHIHVRRVPLVGVQRVDARKFGIDHDIDLVAEQVNLPVVRPLERRGARKGARAA